MIRVVMEDFMGSDLKVCRMAKDSFGRTTNWEKMVCDCGHEGPTSYCPSCDADTCVGVLGEKDRNLLKFLARGMGEKEYYGLIEDIANTNSYDVVERLIWKFRNTTPHLAPFGHNFATFKFEAPVFVMRHVVKHEYIRLSELSMRYVRGMPEYYRPDSWRSIADNVKQGSGAAHPQSYVWDSVLDDMYKEDSDDYKAALAQGICPEQARTILRLCHMTSGHLSGSMDALAGIVIKRLDPHAQKETRDFAKLIDHACAKAWPLSWAALTEGVER